jgi:multimeric flavodoxin WrbA
MNVFVISGSRNPKGQTARAAAGLMAGVVAEGGASEIAFLPQMNVERCRQCNDRGWGLCMDEGRCVIDDDLAGLVEKIAAADAVVFATPVYFSDLSESLKSFLDRVRRISGNADGKKLFAEKPALGICVAGGGGGGAPRCTSELDRTLATCGFAVVDMIPVRKQNLEHKIAVLESTGKWLAGELGK